MTSTEESESQSSVYTESIGDEDRDDQGLNDVCSYLTHELKKLFIHVNKYNAIEDNNPQAPMTGDPQQLLKYEMQLVGCMSQQLRHLNPEGLRRYFSHVELDLIASLKKEVQDVTTLIYRCQGQLDKDKKELADLKEKIKQLEDMYEERKENPEVCQEASLLPVRKKLSEEFNKHRTLMNDMIEKLFRKESDVLANILQAITTAYFDDESGDPYVTVESNYHCLEMLLEADIITRHPHDLEKFRLTNFLQ